MQGCGVRPRVCVIVCETLILTLTLTSEEVQRNRLCVGFPFFFISCSKRTLICTFGGGAQRDDTCASMKPSTTRQTVVVWKPLSQRTGVCPNKERTVGVLGLVEVRQASSQIRNLTVPARRKFAKERGAHHKIGQPFCVSQAWGDARVTRPPPRWRR